MWLGKKEILLRWEDVCFLSARCLVLPTQWVCCGHCGRGQDSPPLPILGRVSLARLSETANMSENWPEPLPQAWVEGGGR